MGGDVMGFVQGGGFCIHRTVEFCMINKTILETSVAELLHAFQSVLYCIWWLFIPAWASKKRKSRVLYR